MEKFKVTKETIAKGVFILALFVIAVVFLFCSCCPKIVERVETKVEYRDRIIRDTTTFEIPVEVEKIVTRDTSSHLENNWAKSDAMVSGGFLSHSLESIPQVVKVPYEVEVHDTLYVKTEAKETVKEVKVEKPLTWWQRKRLDGFWWLLVTTLALLVYVFRKPILSLLRKLSV